MSTQNAPLRTAIIGYGLAGATFHAPLVNATEGLKVSAIVTSNNERQQLAHNQYPGAEIFSSPDQIWANKDRFDLVVVATPNDTHAPLGHKSLEAGIPVVIDKPLAITVKEAEELIAKSKKTGTLLSVFQNRRWDNDLLTIKDLIFDNRLSSIIRMESRFERYRTKPKPGGWRETTSPEAGGGVLFDLGSHLIDQALHLFGKPESVYAEIRTRRAGVEADDDSFVALQFQNGVIAHLWVSMIAKIPGPRFRLIGMRGTYEKWGLDPQENQLKEGIRPGDPMWGEEPEECWGRLSTDANDEDFEGIIESRPGSYEVYYTLMRDAIRGITPVPVPAEDALQTLKIIELARKSASLGQPVRA